MSEIYTSGRSYSVRLEIIYKSETFSDKRIENNSFYRLCMVKYINSVRYELEKLIIKVKKRVENKVLPQRRFIYMLSQIYNYVYVNYIINQNEYL